MDNYVYYYQLDQQYLGTRYLGESAKEFANLLGFKYKKICLNKDAKQIKGQQIFFPDIIFSKWFKNS